MAIEVIEKGSVTPEHPTPLLFVHGACSSAQIWDEHFLDFFAGRGYRAFALSLRGHGGSGLSQRLSSVSIADYVADVASVVSDLNTRPVLIGHSMGCWVVLHFVAKHPGRAQAAVLMAPGTSSGLRRWGLRTFRRHPWLVLRANTFGNSADLFSTPALCREFLFSPDCPEPIVASCMTGLQPESRRAARDLIKPLPPAQRVGVQMLVVNAGMDKSRIDGDVAAVADLYQAELANFPGMGHVMMLEPNWEAGAERIAAWLETHSGDAPS